MAGEAEDWVYIFHPNPDVGGDERAWGPVSRQAFTGEFEGKGWRITDVTFVNGPDGESVPLASQPTAAVPPPPPAPAASASRPVKEG